MKVLCLLSNLLGNKVLSAHYRSAIERIPGLEVEYLYMSPGDYGTHPVPALLRKSNIVESLYVADKVFKDVDCTSYDVVVVGCFEILWAIRKQLDAVPVLTFLDTTPIAARRMLTNRVRTTGAKIMGALFNAAYAALFSPIFRKVSLFLPTSPWCGRSLVDAFGVEPKRVRPVFPALDLSFWNREGKTENMDEPVRMLFVGNDFKRKGGLQLLNIYRRLAGKASLTIISNDPFMKELHLPEGVVHLSNIPHDRMPEHFKAADLFVFPTRHDQLPLVTTEAMACGLPVLTNDVGALSDFVVTDTNGVLFRSDSTEDEWVKAVAELADDREKLARMGRSARQTAERNFAKEDFLAAVEQALKDAKSL